MAHEGGRRRTLAVVVPRRSRNQPRVSQAVRTDSRTAVRGDRALNEHPDEVRYSNLSQCHGLSGLDEIYLEAGRVLGAEVWVDRAARIAATLLELARDS